MAKIIFISGPCGCGKSTFADALAKHMVNRDGKTVYVIHGDMFHEGFVETDDKGDFFVDGKPNDQINWEGILRFNWDMITATADRALKTGMDVVIDYVMENEMPRIRKLAEENRAEFCYIVLTADAAELEKRIRARGDTDLIERAWFLKKKLEEMPENRGHLYDNTRKTTEEMLREIDPEQYRMQ